MKLNNKDCREISISLGGGIVAIGLFILSEYFFGPIDHHIFVGSLVFVLGIFILYFGFSSDSNKWGK